jgi:hypothetical protein
MTGEEATLAVIDTLTVRAVPYMVVGPISTNYYGIPRSTKDADFVVQIEPQSIRSLADALGDGFRLDPQPSFETTTLTVRNVLEVAGSPFTIELFHLSDDPHDQERFRRRKRVRLLNREVMLPTVEDVIITKLRWAIQQRSKDREDVREVLSVQREGIDWDYVHSWCDRHGTRALLAEIRQSIPPMES